jgi:predicted Zn-dependent protease
MTQNKRMRMRRESLGMLAGGLLLTAGLALSLPLWAETGAEPSDGGLSTMEQQVLGQKHGGEPEEVRVQRLEGALNAPQSPATSLSYRKEQLYRLQEAAVAAKQRQAAIVAYNQGIDESTKGQDDMAIAAYRQAIALDPGLTQAYNNLANLLMQNNQYDETVALYQSAIAIRPDDPLLHRNLGVLYEKLGKIEPAIAEYQTYLKNSPTPDAPIQSIVDNYRANRSAGGKSPDYLSATTQSSQGQRLIWPSHSNPIQVYVEPNTPDQMYTIPIVQQALESWERATGGRLRFRQVAAPNGANIAIYLKHGPLSDPNSHIGRAEYQMPEEQLYKHQLSFVRVSLNTGEDTPLQKVTTESRRDQFYRMTLHELGHAVGIWGHSPDPGDIMFAHPIASQLSLRDVQTVRKLYGIAPVSDRAAFSREKPNAG